MGEPKRRRPRLQISLRLLLVVVTVVAIALAYDLRFRSQRRVASQLADATITYHPSPIGWLPWIGDRLRDVKSVDLSHWRADTDKLELLHRFPRIERLYVPRTMVDDEDLAVIAKLRNLKRLALWHTQITDRGIDHLVELKNLEVLDVQRTRLTAASLWPLVKMRQLKELKFSFNDFSDNALEQLAKLPSMPLGDLRCVKITEAGLRSLRKIDRNNYRLTGLTNADISDAALLSLASTGKLPVGPAFKVESCPLTDRVLEALPWDSLTRVSFVQTNVTFDGVARHVGDKIKMFVIGETGFGLTQDWDWSLDRGWAPIGLSVWLEGDPAELTKQQLAKLPNLTGVYVDREKPAGDLLLRLRNHSQLIRFKMSSVPAGTPVIEQIAEWKQLEYADLNCCNPRTNFDMSPLAKLQQLRRLEFNCTPFGDEAFETFGQLSQLRELDMTSADKVKGSGLRQLRNLRHLERIRIQSRANWDQSIEDLMSLDHVKRITLVDVRLSKANRTTFESKKGWDLIGWK